jgi:hypothetical protein
MGCLIVSPSVIQISQVPILYQTFMKKFFFLCCIGVCCAALPACKDPEQSNTTAFDRPAMLRQYANNVIQPAYGNLRNGIEGLALNWEAFKLSPTVDLLDGLRQNWTLCYGRWQAANAYNFGPAGEEGLRKGLIEEIGTFPANTTKIETFIAAGDTSFQNFNRDTRGFLALEYLLFDEANGSLLADTKRQAYCDALIRHLRTRVNEVNSAWATYTTTFAAADGTDVGSSTSQLYNEFVRSFESIKNFKVGLPAGKRPGQTQPEPQLVESYHSDKSLEMMKLHLAAIEKIYAGIGANGQDGLGLKDYVQSVVGGPELVTATEAQWAKVNAALAAVPTDRPLSDLMAENHPTVDALHTELQKHTRYFKSDMSSLLGIAITFSSGDGD